MRGSPVFWPLWGTTISRRGPAEACTIDIKPAAYISVDTLPVSSLLTMNSTTLIPKCSSCIVFRPILASPSLFTISPYGAFSSNETLSWNISFSLRYLPENSQLTLIPRSAAIRRIPSARALSSSFLVPPINVRWTFCSPVRYSG
jgi:hypothetical protein